MAARAARALPGRRFSLLLHLIINGPLLLFKGSFSAASILHLPKDELAQVLGKIEAALKTGGILYTYFKYGSFEGLKDGRYFTCFTDQALEEFWRRASSLRIFDRWITRDVRPGREEERWINILARRI